jgi:hypothetical protein
MVNHPPHYRSHASGVECIAVTRCMTFDGGNSFKYVYRSDAKNGREDLEKARWYLRDILAGTDLSRAVTLFIPSRKPVARQLINQIVAAEVDPVRAQFFRAIREEKCRVALEAVDKMLAVGR